MRPALAYVGTRRRPALADIDIAVRFAVTICYLLLYYNNIIAIYYLLINVTL